MLNGIDVPEGPAYNINLSSQGIRNNVVDRKEAWNLLTCCTRQENPRRHPHALTLGRGPLGIAAGHPQKAAKTVFLIKIRYRVSKVGGFVIY